jgi:hypothetical protein
MEVADVPVNDALPDVLEEDLLSAGLGEFSEAEKGVLGSEHDDLFDENKVVRVTRNMGHWRRTRS